MLSALRNWLQTAVGHERELELLLDLTTGVIPRAAFAAALKLHRSNGSRRVDNYLAKLRKKLKRNDGTATMPSPWREMFARNDTDRSRRFATFNPVLSRFPSEKA